MSFPRAARAALAVPSCLPRILAAFIVVVILGGLFLSCGSSSNNNRQNGPSHNAYVTLPSDGSVRLLFINGATGELSLGAKTPTSENLSPTGLALLPSKKFLYVANSRNNSISTFNVATDGTLTLSSATPTPAGSGPTGMVIDPTGKFLLVTNVFSNDVSVFEIDSGSGALTEVTGSPFFAHANPTEILITASGKFVYVSNPTLGRVTAFTFSSTSGALAEVPLSPFLSGDGALGLAVDGSEHFLYVANPSASNLPALSNVGNVSAFSIDQTTGALTQLTGSPFTASVGNNPAELAVDPRGQYLYAVTSGSSFSVWCFTINSATGQLLTASGSPFSVTAGNLFALIDPSGHFFYIGGGTAIAGYTYNQSTGSPTAMPNSPFSTGTPATPPGKMVLSE